MSNLKPNYFQRRSKPQGPKANERIRAIDVQVIGSDGNNLGTLPLNKAIEITNKLTPNQIANKKKEFNKLSQKEKNKLKEKSPKITTSSGSSHMNAFDWWILIHYGGDAIVNLLMFVPRGIGGIISFFLN